jgi:regulator of RNase E activity RraA
MKNNKLSKLRKFDTPTICNGLELLDNKFKINGYSKEIFFCLNSKIKPMVGYAKTAKISSLKHNKKTKRSIRIDYYEYVNKGNFPKISVIHDQQKNPVGSFWGEVNANIHNKLGCLGVITNGSVRDLDVIPKNFQFLSKTLSPSHAEVSLMEYGTQVNIMGMEIKDNDLIHADVHGAVTFKEEIIDDLLDAIKFVEKKEKIILDSCKTKKFTFAKFKKAFLKSQNLKYKNN